MPAKLRPDSVDTTYWESDTGRFVFGDLNYHNQISIKDNGRGDASTGVYICVAGVCRGLTMPSMAHFWVHSMYTSSVGIYLCLFH